MNRKQYGTYAEQLAVTELLRFGLDVFTPIGDNSKVDLICLIDGFPLKIQVKSQIKPNKQHPNASVFLTESKACQTKNRHGYSIEEVDCFIFVDIFRKELFIIKNSNSLPKVIMFRHTLSKNNQHKNIRYASDFKLCVETLHGIAKSVKTDMLKTKSGLQCENDVVK